MKDKLFLLLLLLLPAVRGVAQTSLHGRIQEITEDHRHIPLANVTIEAEGAGSTTSDEEGFFRLTFRKQKEGDKIIVKNISKPGYEIVSSFFLHQWYISEHDTIDITMVRKENFKRLRDYFCCINSDAYRAGQERQEAAEAAFIDSCARKALLLEDSMLIIEQEYKNALKTIDPYLKKYEKTNRSKIQEANDIEQLLKLLNQEQREVNELQEAANLISKGTKNNSKKK